MKVDVFSVGCMAFMMFTGIPPFDEATRLDPKFRKAVYKGDLQGYLRDYGMQPLPAPVSTHDRPPARTAGVFYGAKWRNSVLCCNRRCD